ncbi:hypothetical protein GGE65_007858 [Skermanella aerolata]|uniref:hypothetical protein n=1 Tax=Skermanella aerolata TaxID=393310 RepID=UPI003D1D8FFC
MEPLFRFALIRPPVAQDPDRLSISIAQDSPFQRALAEAAQSGQPRPELQRVARQFIADPTFIGDPRANPLSAQLVSLASELDRLTARPNVSHADLVAAIERAFDYPLPNFVENGTVDEAKARLRDTLLAIKQLPEEHGRPIEALAQQLRDLEVVDKVASDDEFPTTPAELRRYRRRSLKLPTVADLHSILSTARLEEERRKKIEADRAKRQRQAEALFDKYGRLSKAVDELTNLGGDQFYSTPQTEHKGFEPPQELQPLQVLTGQLSYRRDLADLNLQQLKLAVDRDQGEDRIVAQDRAGGLSAAWIAEQALKELPRLPAGSPTFRPVALGNLSFRLKDSAAQALSDDTRELLDKQGLKVAEHPLDRIVESLRLKIDAAGKDLDDLYYQPPRQSVKRIGDTFVTISTPVASAWMSIATAGPLVPIVPILPPDQRIPQTRGRVVPAGVADLLIVKQQLVRYEAADVAHIENVLKGERKEREHTRRQETEQLTFRETEITSSEERELESTNRFEMTRETSATIQEDASIKAGLTISGKYGPTVEFSASAEGALSRSKEEATKTASTFSQDVTQRSANKITERVLERASLRVTNEVIEKNAHELNNTTGAGHISGVYQWVNKVYQAQMFNYGLRTMFDFMIPEPAAFIMEVMKSAHASTVSLQKPPDFTLKPTEVTEANYGAWVRMYGATDVTPPPEIYKTKSLDFKAGGGDDKTNYNHSAQIMIDEGYEAVQGSVGRVSVNWGNSGIFVDIVLGRNSHRFTPSDAWVFITTLNNERDSIPFGLITNNIGHVAVAVEVKCQRTERAMQKWRFETHAKLTTAYKARLAEYEEKLAALKLEAGVAIRGRNPALNLETMRDELKKNCISILTEQHYDLFNAIDYS